MTALLHLGFDSDAFNFSRSLGLLDDLVALARPEAKLGLHLTGFVARHELTSLGLLIQDLQTAHLLTVWPISTKTNTFELWRKLQDRYDKGESELGAWIATTAPAGTILVSCDKEVPKLSKELKIRS